MGDKNTTTDASKIIDDINNKNNDVSAINDTKQKMIDQLNKQEMVDIIVKQNNIIGHQSIQMLDLINAVDSAVTSSSAKLNQEESNACNSRDELYKHQMNVYHDYISNLMVFFLIVVIFAGWLWYLYNK